MTFVTCWQLFETKKLSHKAHCCESCHTDDEMGYDTLIELELGDAGIENDKYKVIGEICCGVLHALEEYGEESKLLIKEIYEHNPD